MSVKLVECEKESIFVEPMYFAWNVK